MVDELAIARGIRHAALQQRIDALEVEIAAGDINEETLRDVLYARAAMLELERSA